LCAIFGSCEASAGDNLIEATGEYRHFVSFTKNDVQIYLFSAETRGIRVVSVLYRRDLGYKRVLCEKAIGITIQDSVNLSELCNTDTEFTGVSGSYLWSPQGMSDDNDEGK
jgi:hypothetical protein